VRTKGASNANYSRQLLKAIGKVDGLVTSDEEVRKLMPDRYVWRSRISMIIKRILPVIMCAVELEAILLFIII
jgi:hypothetical protein